MKLELNLNIRLLVVQFPTEKLFIENHAFFSVIKIASFEEHVVKFLCKGSDFTEDIAKGLVELHENGYYKDYLNNNNFFTLPSKSFISAIESKGYHWRENPIQSTEPTSDLSFYDSEEDYKTALIKWQEVESMTLNHEKCIIFEIL